VPDKCTVEPFESEGMRFRLAAEGDLPVMLQWRNRPAVRRWFFHSQEILPEAHRRWFKRYLETPDDYHFILETADAQGRPIGQISLSNVDFETGKAEIGRLVIGAAELRGRGLGAIAMRGVSEFANRQWGISEIFGLIRSDNAAIIKTATAAGFALEQLGEGRGRVVRRFPAGGR
jgi:RimJ/RimL family protein N-acetyltransferase